MDLTIFNPFFWIVGFLFLSILVKDTRKKNLCHRTGIILFFVFTNNWMITSIAHIWEYDSILIEDIVEPYDIGIVLGPFIALRNDYPNGDNIIYGELDRLTQAIQLYRKGKYKKIMLCGNDNSDLAKAHLLSLGIPSSDILIEDRSNNTYENAIHSQALLKSLSYDTKRLLLITSAWHMRRAYGCFEKTGLEVTPFSVDYWTRYNHVKSIGLEDLIPSGSAIGKWRSLLREWSTMAYFKLKNYI